MAGVGSSGRRDAASLTIPAFWGEMKKVVDEVENYDFVPLIIDERKEEGGAKDKRQ